MVVARNLHKAERQFRPTFQFLFQTNVRLGFDSTDTGNKRRFFEIPFDNVLATDPDLTLDPGLKNRIRNDVSVLEAVLAWIVTGCIRWRNEGLHIPASVLQATKGLFASNDFLNDFLTERCVIGPDERVFGAPMSVEYLNYCVDEHEEPARGRTLKNMLKERGFIYGQVRIGQANGKGWTGIRLKTPLERDEENNEENNIHLRKPPGKGGTLNGLFAEEAESAA